MSQDGMTELGDIYPNSGCDSNIVNLPSGKIYTYEFEPNGLPTSMTEYPFALQLVFKFNKYREVKPYVAVLDSFNFKNIFHRPSGATTDV